MSALPRSGEFGRECVRGAAAKAEMSDAGIGEAGAPRTGLEAKASSVRAAVARIVVVRDVGGPEVEPIKAQRMTVKTEEGVCL